jgi:outer membrane protein assembly factor BamB
LNADNGEEVWYFDGGLIQASPALAGGVVYVGGINTSLYALNALTGSKIWEFSTGSYIRGEAVVADGIVYVGTLDGTVYAIGAKYYVIDFNYDGKVNYQDIYMFLGAYINHHEDRSYDAKYDFDNDSDIDSADLFTFAEYYKDFHHNN